MGDFVGPKNHLRDLVISQDLGSLRLAGKEDWVHAFNVLALREDATAGTRGAPVAQG